MTSKEMDERLKAGDAAVAEYAAWIAEPRVPLVPTNATPGGIRAGE